MELITAPNKLPNRADLFLAGGISNCPDWQSEVAGMLTDLPITVLNPRREDIVEWEGNEAASQIEWEYKALQLVDTVLFWFPEETLCPITLLELGVFTERKNVKLFVGTHPGYKRRFDVITQLRLSRPEVQVYSDLNEMAFDIISEYIPVPRPTRCFRTDW